MNDSQPAVRVVDVSKSFGATRVLSGIDLDVNHGEFVSLLGPSGCGKSTLLRILSGLESADSGRIHINGVDMTSMPPHARPTNMVFQRGALFPHMNVFDNIAYGLKLRRWSKERIGEKVEQMLALVRMDEFAGRGAGALSGGQAQRVALARALAPDPAVLLLDEPLSALDLKLRQQMQVELRRIHRELGATFVFVTHDQTEALAMSDRIAIMNGGVIEQYGTPREIYRKPASTFASTFIGETNLLSAEVLRSAADTVTVRCADAELTVPSAALSPGSRVTLSVRPEDVRVHPGSAADVPAGLRARLDETIYLGRYVRLRVTTADRTSIWVETNVAAADRFAVGEQLVVDWDPTAANLWEATDE